MNIEQYLLTKIAEEAAEIVQIALKCQQFGMDEKLSGQELTNEDRMWGEVNDLMAALGMLKEKRPARITFDPAAQAAKVSKVMKYLQYSVDLGQVNPT